MIISVVALILFTVLVVIILIGGRLRRLLPAEQLSAESKDAVKLALGLVGTMTAILLGLLISSAKSAFDTTRSEVIQMAQGRLARSCAGALRTGNCGGAPRPS